MKKRMITGALLLLLGLTMAGCGNNDSKTDLLQYEGKAYEPVTFNQDIFGVTLGVEGVFETDVTYPIEGAQFDMVHNNGDLYVTEGQAGEAANYYQDDANYDWEVSIFAEDEEEDPVSPIQITSEELEYIYGMEDQEKDQAIYFDEIQQQATLIKTSKDGIARGSIELALYDDRWYWRTEVIDDTQEKDGTWPEYIYPMPESFQNKIKL